MARPETGGARPLRALPPPGRTRKAAESVRRAALPLRRSKDAEFLPAALEILETPPSPLSRIFLWVICGMLAMSLVWSILAKIDIYAVASGRIQFNGRSKTVQPLEAGKVRFLAVENGRRVQEGDLLVEIDPTEAQADVEANAREVEALGAEIVRRRLLVEAASANEEAEPALFLSREISSSIREREQRALTADWTQLNATRASLMAQLEQSTAQKVRLRLSIDAREKLVGLLNERVDMREKLISRDAGTRASVIDAMQQYQSEVTNLAYDKGQVSEADAAIKMYQRRIDQQRAEFISTQTDKLGEAENKRDRVQQDLIKARAKQDRTRLLAPTSGTVQQLAVTSIGQVVTSGQPLMVVVPSDGSLEVEALVPNRDIGFVEAGQKATVKIDAFPFTRYGKIEAEVVRVSRDAVDDRDINGSTDTTNIARGQGVAQTAATPKTQNLVFPVTLKLPQSTFLADGRYIPLTPGMTVSVEIRTGERRVIDYLLSPLRELSSQAAHER